MNISVKDLFSFRLPCQDIICILKQIFQNVIDINYNCYYGVNILINLSLYNSAKYIYFIQLFILIVRKFVKYD